MNEEDRAALAAIEEVNAALEADIAKGLVDYASAPNVARSRRWLIDKLKEAQARVTSAQSDHLDSLRKVRAEVLAVQQRLGEFHEELNELLPRPFGTTLFGAIQALKKDAALGAATRVALTFGKCSEFRASVEAHIASETA